MIYTKLIAAGVALALTVGTSASAQMSNGMMKADHMGMDHMKMSTADMTRMKRCQKMTHKVMMKSRSCAAMMKSHPDMMKSGIMSH